jgi:acyl-CoA thioester hydrolase
MGPGPSGPAGPRVPGFREPPRRVGYRVPDTSPDGRTWHSHAVSPDRVPPLEAAAFPLVHPVRVRFAETDAMGVVHHAAYLPWLEEARVALLAAAGHDYAELHQGGLDLAVVDLQLRYRRAVRFGDPVEVHTAIAGATRTLLELAYLVTVGDEPAASGTTTHVCVDPQGRPTRIPTWLADLATGDFALRS